MREVIKTAKTVEEATALALAELGVSADDACIEILEMPRREFLFKKVPAKVRAYIEDDSFEPKAAKPAPKKDAPVKAAPKAEKPAPKKEAPKAEKPAPNKEEKPQPEKQPEKPQPAPAKPEEPELPEEPIELEACPKAKEAVEYLKDVCMKMGAGEIAVTPVKQGENVILKVEGEGAGTLIGHRGEVMEALSYLTSLVANRSGGDYMKIGLDINHYRSKREANLTALAKRIGAKVQRTGRSHTLEPMNPYERRIIHSAISEIEGVKSESVGEGANRRVVISSTDPNARPARSTNRRPANKGGRPGAGRGPRAPRRDSDRAPRAATPAREFADRPRDEQAAPIVPKRTETINDGADLPLYGKIEL